MVRTRKREINVPELKPPIQRTSLVLRDPRRYALCPPNSFFVACIRTLDWRVGPFAFEEAVAFARDLIAAGELGQIEHALRCAGDADQHSAVQAVLTKASCVQKVANGEVQVLFGIPVTLHPIRWPTAEQPRLSWLDFSALTGTLAQAGFGRAPQRLHLLPHLFAIEDLCKLSWMQWNKVALVPMDDLGQALQLLPSPRSFDRVKARSPQARMVVGTLVASKAQAEQFIDAGLGRESELVALLVEELQRQFGGRDLRIVAGVPMLATAALSNGVHMNNLAQLSCVAELLRAEMSEALKFEAEAITAENGEGVMRFRTKSTTMDWTMSKSEPWEALQMHWRTLLNGTPASYVQVQLGLRGRTF